MPILNVWDLSFFDTFSSIFLKSRRGRVLNVNAGTLNRVVASNVYVHQ
jgi:hypothetical protein